MNEQKVDAILEQKGFPKVSISMPTHVTGEEIKQGPIRLKNLIKNAHEELLKKGLKKMKADEILAPAEDLLSKPKFWTHQQKGLVLYAADDYFEVIQIPYTVSENAYVNDHFLITPVLPMISLNGTFSVLAISRQNARLLRCTRNEVNDITPDDAETSMDVYLEEAPEKELQFHTGASGDDAMFFGHGSKKEERMNVLHAYFRQLEKSITAEMKKNSEPLVLIGLEDNLAIYKKANDYNRVMDDTITVNPDEMSNLQLKDQGWEVIKKHFLKEMYHSLDQFSEKDNEKVSNNMVDIIENTVMGKSKTIFIAENESKWGFYDADNHEVHFTDEEGEEAVDLLNWLAIKGRETGSNVYLLPKEDMPTQATVAAEYRF